MEKNVEQININDEEQSLEQVPNEAGTGKSQPYGTQEEKTNITPEEQPKDGNRHTENQQQEEPKPIEPELERLA